jgi:hypothetical protein
VKALACAGTVAAFTAWGLLVLALITLAAVVVGFGVSALTGAI